MKMGDLESFFIMGNLVSIKKSDMKFFEAARNEAKKSFFPRFHVGCVVVYQGNIIAAACNTEKSDTIQKKYNHYRHFNNYESHKPINHSAHAEIKALKSIPYPVAQQIDWKRVKVFTVRIAPGLPGGVGLSRPCLGCEHYIRDLGIRDIYYTGNGSYIHERLIY